MVWPSSLKRPLLDAPQSSLGPQSRMPHPSGSSNDQDGDHLRESEKTKWLRKIVSKDTHTAKEGKEPFHGPDTSSLTAFLLSLLSCSESGVRCADDPPESELDEVIAPPVASTSKSSDVHYHKKKIAGTKGLPKESLERESHRIQRDGTGDSRDSRPAGIEDDENDWQLVTEEDLSVVSASRNQKIVLPEMSDSSAILLESFRSSLYLALPTLVRGRQWVLLYSTRRHGISLLTLYRRSGYLSGPCLLVAEDTRGAVFGGLLLSPLQPTSKKKYQGTSETFVFTNVLGKMSLFRPTGLNRYFVLCTNDALAFGGGGCFALHLDGELLRGSSGPCETFGNCCLAHSEEFALKNVELWGFAHTSRYVPRQASFKEPIEALGVCRW